MPRLDNRNSAVIENFGQQTQPVDLCWDCCGNAYDEAIIENAKSYAHQEEIKCAYCGNTLSSDDDLLA